MQISIEPNGYRLELSDSHFQELGPLHHQIFFVFTTTGTVILKLSQQDLADINSMLMERIATERCRDRHASLMIHTMIDEFVANDGLHEGYPNTWPWTEVVE